MKCYHFTTDTLRDGSPLPAMGRWLEHIGPVIPCESGLHGSEHPFDALTYAPGSWLHRVELEGDLIAHGTPTDKWVGRRRKILATLDASGLLWAFARWCALQVIDLWDAPSVVREYLTTGDEALQAAAKDAARAAAKDAAWDAARTARAAAKAAAWDAAWDAAGAAAKAAARAAAWDAAGAVRAAGAAWDAAGAVRAAAGDAGDAARDAAWDAGAAAGAAGAARAARAAAWDAGDAARDAARDAQRQQFLSMVESAFARLGKT